MAYEHLSDEDKLTEAIKFVAVGQPLPRTLTEFLREADLYELIVNPVVFDESDLSVNSPNQ